MASLTATPDPATGSVLLDVEQTLARDLFTRVVANGWGTSTTGQPWTVTSGVVGDFSVNGTQGLHSVNTLNASRITQITPGTGPDMGAIISASVPVVASGAPINSFLLLRYADNSNFYYAQLRNNVGTPPTLIVGRRVISTTDVPLATIELPNNWAAGATFFIRFDVCGSRLRAKAWRNTVAEPDWMIEITDFSLTTSGNVGVRSQLATGNTNVTPVVFTYDNFVSYVSQPLRIFRITSNGVRTELRGSPLNTANPTAAAETATATLWDNEAPLDTPLNYVMFSGCTDAIVVSGSPVTLDGQGGGWIRDPEVPSNNIRIAFSDLQFNDCDATMRVELLDWEPRVYRNASGIFDIVNSQRPSTVSMRRKRYESSMTFASKTLDDVDDVEEIIAPGRILLLSLPVGYGFGRPYGSDYITISDVTQDPVDTDNYLTPFRSWEVPFALSPPPVDLNEGGTGSNGIGGGGATYADMTASAIGTSYATTTATGLTYQQLAQGVGY